MNIVLNIRELIRQYIAPHRRQPNRINWLSALIDLQSVYDAFATWRSYYRYKVHITSQHKALQGHLNKTFGGGIIIKSYDDQYLDVGLNTEPAHWVLFNPWQEISLEGESEMIFADADFVVYAPAGIDLNLLIAEIEKYKLADKVYKIIIR